VVGKIFGLKKAVITDERENFNMNSFIIYILHQISR
jgi:hypothetical protein